MKKKFFYIAALIMMAINLFAGGKVIESMEMKSKILNYPVKYSVYLPEDYDRSLRSYPVVYLFHGTGDDETSWIQFGELCRYLDENIKNGTFPPAIFILPDGKLSWYSNDVEKKDAWRDMFIKELIPTVEKAYRIRSKREFRAIAGNSMGGFGVLSVALNYPELFSTCIPMSAAIFTDEEIVNMDDMRYSERFAQLCGIGLKGKDRLTENWKAISPFYLIEKYANTKNNPIRFYFDCGDKDYLIKGNMMMHLKMNELKIPHEFRIREGNHGWPYWRSGLINELKFIGDGFHR
ncbi:MAG: alpha/beta hydrolase family protein [Bacteroidota bacterium]|nr:alpha/beta hydrolase family protein [Bacteroidota bacterium]